MMKYIAMSRQLHRLDEQRRKPARKDSSGRQESQRSSASNTPAQNHASR